MWCQKVEWKSELIGEKLNKKAEKELDKWDIDGNLQAIMAIEINKNLIRKQIQYTVQIIQNWWSGWGTRWSDILLSILF